MPKVKRVIVTVGGKIGLGNFENAERAVTLEADLLKDERELDAIETLHATARIALAAQVEPLVREAIDPAWMNGEPADWIRRHIVNVPPFEYLKRLDATQAEALVQEMIDLYAKAPAVDEVAVPEETDIPFAEDGDDDWDDGDGSWDTDEDEDDWDDDEPDDEDDPVPAGMTEGV